jgi:hypothetical protein
LDRRSDFTLVLSEAVNHLGIGHLNGWLAEDVSVDKIFHSVFGRLQLDWHEKTLLGAGDQPIDYTHVRWCRSPFESVLIAIDTFDVELLTGCCRISAGGTIWPFDETVVFIGCKIASYSTRSRNNDVMSRHVEEAAKLDTR